MTQSDDKRSVDHEVAEIKASIEKYFRRDAELTSEVAADLTKAIHDLSGHVADLHRRIEKIEQSHAEWTTRGWMPPPGSDRPS